MMAPCTKVIVSTPLVASVRTRSIIHYKPTLQRASVITDKDVYLCDTGGQYGDGTTDYHADEPFWETSRG